MRAVAMLFFGLGLVAYVIAAGVITDDEGLAFTSPDIKWAVISMALVGAGVVALFLAQGRPKCGTTPHAATKPRQLSKGELEYLRLRQQHGTADEDEHLTDDDLAKLRSKDAGQDE